MSSTYAAPDATQPQNPGLQDSTIDTGTAALDRAEDREQGLGSDPGITNKATTAMHQGMDQATSEQTPSASSGASSSSYAASDATQVQSPGLKDDAVDAGTDSLARAEAREQGVGYDPDAGSGSYGSSDTTDATQTQTPGLKDDAVDAGTDSLARAEAREQGVGYDPDAGSGSSGSSDATETQTTGEPTQSGGEKGVADQVSEVVGGVASYITKNLK